MSQELSEHHWAHRLAQEEMERVQRHRRAARMRCHLGHGRLDRVVDHEHAQAQHQPEADEDLGDRREGELLADVVACETDSGANACHFAQTGAIMAAMHDQASSWIPPVGFRRHALDADGLMGP